MAIMIEIIDNDLTGHVVNVRHIVAISDNKSGERILLLSTGKEIVLHESEDMESLLERMQGPEE